MKQKIENLKVCSEYTNELFFDEQGNVIIEKFITNTKQETIEEASERLATASPKIFKDGAKWQQERSYSEEDMIDYSNYRLLIKKALSPKEWFEQFKKK